MQDKLTKYIPDFIEPAGKVTIENLLLHNSGIKDYTKIPGWSPSLESQRSLEDDINLVKKKEFFFPPGRRFMYNNTGFAILAFIIEKVSGMRYGEFMKKNIFIPLGMNHTRHRASTDDIGLRSKGYSINSINNNFTRFVIPGFAQLSGPGFIISTVDDLLKFDRAVKNRQLLSEESWEKATSKIINAGMQGYYGYGWMINDIGGHDINSHTGGLPGFTSANYFFVNDDVTIIFLSNANSINPVSMVVHAAAYMFNLNTDRRNPASISTDILKKYEGIYHRGRYIYEIKLVYGKLIYNTLGCKYLPGALVPTSRNTFYIDGRYDGYVSFPFEKDKPVNSVFLS